ncbi:hypothetical protein [Streptomyces sp. NPDC052610]|uniref:hypothetical protein n=1 Tax=Streptomyces sp. NPDC052610 TaxID=3154952 RepID=UPI003437C6AA
MTAVFLIQGTGVREPGFPVSAGRVATGPTALRDGLRIVPYDRGGTHGATLAARAALYDWLNPYAPQDFPAARGAHRSRP